MAFYSSTFEKTEYQSEKGVCPRLTIREELGFKPSPLPPPSQPQRKTIPSALGSGSRGRWAEGRWEWGPETAQKCREKRSVMFAAQWPPPLSEGARLRNDTAPLSARGLGPRSRRLCLQYFPSKGRARGCAVRIDGNREDGSLWVEV